MGPTQDARERKCQKYFRRVPPPYWGVHTVAANSKLHVSRKMISIEFTEDVLQRSSCAQAHTHSAWPEHSAEKQVPGGAEHAQKHTLAG